MTSTHALFVYGTLMSPEVVNKVLKSQKTQHTVTQNVQLSGYKRHRVQGELYPAAIPHTGSSITGALIEGITDEELEFLDKFEGEDYTRVQVKVTLSGELGNTFDSNVYEWSAGEHRLSPEDWVLDDTQIRRFLETF